MLDFVIESAIKVLVVFSALMGIVAYTTLLERKVIGRIQVRHGPNRVGPFGIWQPVADGLKGFFKEDIIPANADKVLYVLGPALSIIPVLMMIAVVPFGDSFTLFGREITLRITDVNVALLYILGLAGLGEYGVMLGGWASNNRYALIGSIRAAAQMISYELAMGLALVSVIMVSGSLSLVDIVHSQANLWNMMRPILWVPFVLYLICGLAEINRTPFDMPEAEAELACGFNVEYSSMKFAMFFMAEYAHLVTLATLVTCLFLGGWTLPFGIQLPGPLPFLVFMGKVFLVMFFFIWERATFPRFRYDQIMRLGWKVMMPLAIANIVVVGAFYTLVV